MESKAAAPMTIHPLLDPENQKRAKRYAREKRRFGLAGLAASAAALALFQALGWSARLSRLFAGRSLVAAVLVYAAAFIGWATLWSLPVRWLSGYVHERRWGFSTQTRSGWVSDQVKGFAVSWVFASIGLGLWLFALWLSPRLWWLLAGAGSALIGVVLTALVPVVILPLFNRYTPIADPELTGALRDLLAREGLKSGGFFREDMSRRTRKENAFLAGLGRTKRVVLGDTLAANMTVPEIVSVVGHEVGHDRGRHLWKGIAAGTVEQFAVFFVLDRILRAAVPGFPGPVRFDLAWVPVAVLAGGAVGAILGPLGSALSRRFERDADRFAAARTDPRAFLTALAGLANRNLADAYPRRWVKILTYSHPPIGERLEDVERRAGLDMRSRPASDDPPS